MAFFIVIGTDNDVKVVVDEIKRAHLQHNVITSGCILREDDGLYYHWDVFNEQGNKTKESKEAIVLHDVLTNQISQFKILLPDDVVPNVFIVSKCFDNAESYILQTVCDELYQIGGAMLSGLQVDIVLLGYDLNKPEDVTIRPDWKLLESIRGLGEGSRFHTNILYINNMDYMGAATNVNSRVLSRFLCHWSKMVCAGGYDPKATIQSHVYSIGMSEHQYDFRDLNDFFKLSAEERLLNRTLNDNPSSDTQELLDTNYFKKIDLGIPWLDGLCYIQSLWNSYCTTPWDPSKPLGENCYSVSQQELTLASYLNSFLQLYISEEHREIDILKAEIMQKELEISACTEQLKGLEKLPDEDDAKEEQINSINEQIAQLKSGTERCKKQIDLHAQNIANNTFHDADAFYERFGNMELITEDDEAAYASNKAKVEQLLDYVKSDSGIGVMREAINRATVIDSLPNPYPASEVLNMGRVKAISLTPEQVPSIRMQQADSSNADGSNDRHGCLCWFKSLFKKNKPYTQDTNTKEKTVSSPAFIAEDANKFLHEMLGKSVAAMKKAEDVRLWWERLCDIIEKDQKRQAECILLMDGEKDINGDYIPGIEGYRPPRHHKSISLIDMERVRSFRDSDAFYKQTIDKFLYRWFDKTIEFDKRMTMLELIKHQVLDSLVGQFHTLQWNGQNPFVQEMISDEEMHEYIEHDLRHSKPFVEYVRIQESKIASNLNIGFFSNNPNIPTDASDFKNRFNVSTESLTPVFLQDFVNSLCVIQIMDIPEHVDALKDFKPRRETVLSRLRTDFKNEVVTIIGEANTVEEKAKAIYNWICDNIAYDTTKQILDAETCYKTKRGVCQAYCELFCYMAESVGLTADIISGKTKDSEGRICDNHSWIFVYTHAYDGFFIDPTWGACDVDGRSTWFNVSPYWMIFSHFPEQAYWLKLDINITDEQFKKLPVVAAIDKTDGKDYLFECISKIQ